MRVLKPQYLNKKKLMYNVIKENKTELFFKVVTFCRSIHKTCVCCKPHKKKILNDKNAKKIEQIQNFSRIGPSIVQTQTHTQKDVCVCFAVHQKNVRVLQLTKK